MRAIVSEIIPDRDTTTAYTPEALILDLNRTALQGETDRVREVYLENQQAGISATAQISPQRASFEQFWQQYNDCSPGEKLKYQQGIADGGFICNYIGTYASQESGFGEDVNDDARRERFQSIKKRFEVHRFAYPRQDGTWGGFCMIKQKDTLEWVICNTKIEFINDEDGKKRMQGEMRIFGRGKLFEHISEKFDAEKKDRLLTGQLENIVSNLPISRKISEFVKLDSISTQTPTPTSFFTSKPKPKPANTYDLLTPAFFETLRMPPQLSPNTVSQPPEQGESAEAASYNRMSRFKGP